jgi:hypothetical protein
MSSNAAPTLSLDDIKAQIHELRMARKINTMRLNAGFQYVSQKIQNEAETRAAEHEKIKHHIDIFEKDLYSEKIK